MSRASAAAIPAADAPPRTADRAAAFAVSALQVRLGGQPVLGGIDLSVAAGAWTSIVGPNGAGKSTLLRLLAGLLAPQGGTLCWHGVPLERIARRQRARQLSWLGQNQGAADELRVYDVAMLGRLPHQRWLAAPSAEDRAAVERALRSTQAWQWRDRALADLSGGERQRVLLARALAVDADTLLMDEPLANLDPPHQADWQAIVRAQVALGRTVVSVLHELTMALAADRIVVMEEGCVVHHGACDDPRTHAALEAVFDHRVQVRRLEDRWIALPR